MTRLAAALACALCAAAEDRVRVHPPGARTIGPYSPGLAYPDVVYVSGQGALDAHGRMPDGFEARVRLTFDNIKAILSAAGLTLDHVVYAQSFLDDMANYAVFDRVWRETFREPRPARSLLGLVRMPAGTPVEVNAIAVRDPRSRRPQGDAAMWGAGKLYLGGVSGRDPAAALAGVRSALRQAGLAPANLAAVTVYLAGPVTEAAFEAAYRRFLGGATPPALTVIRASALPGGANVQVTGVAAP